MKKENLLSKAEMKKVLGGNEEFGKCYKCCPDGHPESSQCSLPSKKGKEPECSMGVPYETPCA